MNKERYNQIIDEVFKKYGDSHWTPPENPNGPLLLDQLWSLKPMQHSKEGFIQACKTDKEFSEKWGLKIEERELSLEEQIDLALECGHDSFDLDMAMCNSEDGLTEYGIPAKLITVTYNNETIEVYE